MKSKILRLKISYLIIAFLLLLGGYILGKFETVDKPAQYVKRQFTETIAHSIGINDRKLVLMENPSLINRIMEGGSFGNDNFSVVAAQNMFGKSKDVIDDIINKTEIEYVAGNVCVIHLPIVNSSVIETNEGLVIIDTGMTPAGPAILNTIKSISDKKIHTIIYTHGHVDHSYGTWALVKDGSNPQIIAQENISSRFERYLKLRGSLAKYMSQPLEQLPLDSTDLIWPTRTFREELLIEIGGVTFHLKHFEGETDDQLFVWMPTQQILFGADYYQGFLPNAGNGKRIQRNITEWISALEFMFELKAEILIPSHGEVLTDSGKIKEALSVHYQALKFIYDYTISSLNAGKRKDQIIEDFVFPDRFANHSLLKEQYVTAKDICKMVIMQYTGWWDDIPSHWSPSRIEDQALSIVQVAGGIDNIIEHISTLKHHDLPLASHFVDWAYYAFPEDPRIHELALEIYKKRILDKRSMTQEMLVYLDHMAEIRSKMK